MRKRRRNDLIAGIQKLKVYAIRHDDSPSGLTCGDELAAAPSSLNP
jgi:hypothetical protein